MSATSIQLLTIVFSDPAWTIGTEYTDFAALNSSVSAPSLQSSYIQTISNSASAPGQDVVGLLYTPDIPPTDPCFNASSPYVPANVTRQGSLPNEDYNLIAIAPLINTQCTLAYLRAAREDPINGFLFFGTDENNTGMPPTADDPIWDLEDGGDWKSRNKYPVYSINGRLGHDLMVQSSLYSGNMTTVPYGHLLAAAYDPRDYVRLYVDITLAYDSSLPSLWVFLIIVVCILIAVIATILSTIYFLHRRRRVSLRRRIINGEVDLELLGIQRLIVPQDLLDRMPIFEYGTAQLNDQQHQTDKDELDSSSSRQQSSSSNEQNTPIPSPIVDHLFQTTCAICLDDFACKSEEESGSDVRQLPCKHIFHPECVDSFLRENSSLCPVCKTSALPKGYCPKVITNAMVNRERKIRRRRERTLYGSSVGHTQEPYIYDSLLRSEPDPEDTVALRDPAIASQRRSAWARQRATALLGRRKQEDGHTQKG